ncbi:MAG: hypothetical protein R3Y55_03835 [Rikenellaceae bacterium]
MRMYFDLTGYNSDFWYINALALTTEKYGTWCVEGEEEDGSPLEQGGISGRWKGCTFENPEGDTEETLYGKEVAESFGCTLTDFFDDVTEIKVCVDEPEIVKENAEFDCAFHYMDGEGPPVCFDFGAKIKAGKVKVEIIDYAEICFDFLGEDLEDGEND